MKRGFITETLVILVALIALKYFWHIDVVGYLSDRVEALISKFK